jgi:hypothetical protein
MQGEETSIVVQKIILIFGERAPKNTKKNLFASSALDFQS